MAATTGLLVAAMIAPALTPAPAGAEPVGCSEPSCVPGITGGVVLGAPCSDTTHFVFGTTSWASGYMIWYHQQVDREQQRRAEFAAAASQAAVTLMSIDSATAEENVRQIVDNSTGQFKEDFQSSAEDLVKVAHDSKSATKATARASAVQSMTADSAVVLVSTATTVSNSAGANQQPRNWRLSVTMVKEGGQIKMSKVEFVP